MVKEFMDKNLSNLFIVFFVCSIINAQSLYLENDKNFIEENKWDKNWFDLRIIDIPQIGLFYCIDYGNNILFRITMPMTFPVALITPINVTYASSYWGINCLLMDATFGMDISEAKLSDLYLLRFLPISMWGGLPLSSKGMGIYILFETVPFNIFNDSIDNYKNTYYGIGINTGIKYIISKHMEIELKYENYFSYNVVGVWNKYIGLTFKYRLFEPGYYGPW